MENPPDIRNQLSSKDLFDAFKAQLAKDFEQSNFQSDFAETLKADYIQILEKIAGELERNEKRSGTNIMQLLYRVDISEGQLKKYLNKRRDEDHYKVMAELIIKRVLQKVVVKRFYKNREEAG